MNLPFTKHIQPLRGVRGVYSAFGCQRPVAVQFQVEYARNTLIFLWLRFGHENAPWEARIGGGNDPWIPGQADTKDAANVVSPSSGTCGTKRPTMECL